MALSEEELDALAGAPVMTKTDEATIRERDADDIIKLDQYTAGKNLQAVPWGLKIAKGKPPSALG